MKYEKTNENFFPDDSELIELKNNTEFEETEKGKSTESDQVTDFNLVRKAMKEVLQSTQSSITQAISLANSCDDPKGYSALASLINSFTNISDKLLDLHENNKKEEKPQETSNTITNVDKQIIFQGTTAEALRLIKDNNGKSD